MYYPTKHSDVSPHAVSAQGNDSSIQCSQLYLEYSTSKKQILHGTVWSTAMRPHMNSTLLLERDGQPVQGKSMNTL